MQTDKHASEDTPELKVKTKPVSFGKFIGGCLAGSLLLATLCSVATGSLTNDSVIMSISFFSWFITGLALGYSALAIWALVDCLKHEPSQGNEKIVWVLLIILTGGVGALLYMAIRRPTRIREFGI